jgi:galactonate dehydratase
VALIRRTRPAGGRIVAGWAADYEAEHARELGFAAETDMDAIIQVHLRTRRSHEDHRAGNVRLAERPNLIWLQVETDEGLTGLGETFFGPGAVEAHLHETVAPKVIGRDPLQIDLLAADLTGYLGYRSTGAEMRGNSAFDLALWDMFGQATGLPVAQLAGRLHPAFDPHLQHLRRAGLHQAGDRPASGNFGLGDSDLDDLTGFLTRADELALSLLDEGITAMKIWPFDTAAEATRGPATSARRT